ncbi:pilus assembly protein TadG-related protein [Mesorhizobium sp. YIM 152430]|uniref:pilus assembly protein TadG-related protein n=1 Tax=Mesorhizobium sp. YIM 152430 TaxID=3031761 RepID=UPI0023DC9EDF|nr:pilus assembly protein TadG-related protein [Mesorhizobium sp. YIM 152430]MDF1600557.1 pilus assembly protein TadG-related protein [Mesorhizobium sp. YIM 152430]
MMLKRFAVSESGNFAAIFAIAAIPVVTAVAGAVDIAQTQRKASQVQQALDATALAMANLEMNGTVPTVAQAEAYFQANLANWSGAYPDFSYIAPTNPDSFAVLLVDLQAQAILGEAAEGELVRGVTASFRHEGITSFSVEWNVTRQASVRMAAGLPACILALNRTAASAVKIQGSTEVSMAHCVLAANSSAEGAISRGGAAKIKAECVTTVGTVNGFGSSLADLECEAPLERRWQSTDPMRDVTIPSYTNCQKAVGTGKAKSLKPGTYCGERISGEVVMEPGTYILRGGSISLNGNGSLTAPGVTIFLLDDAAMSIGANQIVQLSPPTSGTYKGISVYQEQGNRNAMQILGTSGSAVSGIIYAPSAHVQFAGNATANAAPECLRIIADTIEMTGNSTFESDCEDEFAGRKIEAEASLSLIR